MPSVAAVTRFRLNRRPVSPARLLVHHEQPAHPVFTHLAMPGPYADRRETTA